jgi:hypothetical protein
MIILTKIDRATLWSISSKLIGSPWFWLAKHLYPNPVAVELLDHGRHEGNVASEAGRRQPLEEDPKKAACRQITSKNYFINQSPSR